MSYDLPPLIEVGKVIGFSLPILDFKVGGFNHLVSLYYKVAEIRGKWILLEDVEKTSDGRNVSKGWWNTDLMANVWEPSLKLTNPELWKKVNAEFEAKLIKK
jgi:hypothetical protein